MSATAQVSAHARALEASGDWVTAQALRDLLAEVARLRAGAQTVRSTSVRLQAHVSENALPAHYSELTKCR